MAVIILEVSTRYNYIFIDKFLSVPHMVFFSGVFGFLPGTFGGNVE